MRVEIGEDGVARCWWGTSTADYMAYHDNEWGRGVTSNDRLFEKLCLEGFQSGLSWLTILRKRENFRAAFAGFDPYVVAEFDRRDIDRLLADAGIVRHGGKIRSSINNARCAIQMIDQHGSLGAYFWVHADLSDVAPASIEAKTDLSTRLSKDLKQRGWSFVGPTTIYAFMQAMGLVNDHLDGCEARVHAQRSRLEAAHAVRREASQADH